LCFFCVFVKVSAFVEKKRRFKLTDL